MIEEKVYKPLPSEAVVKRAAKVLGIYANIDEIKVVKEPPQGEYDVIETARLKVYVKVKLDERTKALGLAKEVIRRIQVMRKEMDLPLDYVVSKVELYTTSEELKKAIEMHKDYIAKEVRAREIVLTNEPIEGKKWDVEGSELTIKVEK